MAAGTTYDLTTGEQIVDGKKAAKANVPKGNYDATEIATPVSVGSLAVNSWILHGNTNTNLNAVANAEQYARSRAGHAKIRQRHQAQENRWAKEAANRDAAFLAGAKNGKFDYGGFWMGDRKWGMLGEKGEKLTAPLGEKELGELNAWAKEIMTGKDAKGGQRWGGKFNTAKLPKGLITFDGDGNPVVDASKITTNEQYQAVRQMMGSDRAAQGKAKFEQRKRDERTQQNADRYLIQKLMDQGVSRNAATDRIEKMAKGTRLSMAGAMKMKLASDATDAFLGGDITEGDLRSAYVTAGIPTSVQDVVLSGTGEVGDVAVPAERMKKFLSGAGSLFEKASGMTPESYTNVVDSIGHKSNFVSDGSYDNPNESVAVPVTPEDRESLDRLYPIESAPSTPATPSTTATPLATADLTERQASSDTATARYVGSWEQNPFNPKNVFGGK